MKISKKLSLILILSFLLIATQISCDSKEQPTKPSEETQSELESSNDIYLNYPVRDYPIGKSNDSKLYWNCSENDFGNYLGEYNGLSYNGFHSGEDWNLKGGDDGSIDEGKPVYSIGTGKVLKVSPLGRTGSLGYLVAIEHSGNFVIPSKELSSNGQNASYGEEKVNKIYSIYMHLKDIEVNENDDVDENSVIGSIMNPGGGPHLHFEIRHLNSIPSSNWSMVYGSSGEYDKSNWQLFLNGSYNGYYKNLQKMIGAGLRDPSDFIEANYKNVEEYKSQEEAAEEESVEEKTLYDDPVLQYLGWKQEDIIDLYGEPDDRGAIGGPGGEFLYYSEKNISFIFAGDEKVVNNIDLYPGEEVLGVQVGMTFDEIEEILGTPRYRGYDDLSCQGYSIVYFLGKEQYGVSEVEIYFDAPSDDAPTELASIYWKMYWWEK